MAMPKLDGEALKRRRILQGLTASAAAELAGVTQSTWSHWEAGDRGAAPANLEKICETLGLGDKLSILAEVEP